MISQLFERRSLENPATSLSDPAAWLLEAFGADKSAAGFNIGPESARNISTVYACDRLIKEAVASIPIMLFRRRRSGGRDRVTDHWAYELLHDRWEESMPAFAAKETAQNRLTMRGNWYARTPRDSGGRVQRMELLENHEWQPRIVRSVDGSRRKVLANTNRDEVLDVGEFVHVPGPGNGLVGNSVVSHARDSMGLALAAQEFASAFYANGATLSGALEHPQELSEAAQKRLEKKFAAQHAGAAKAFKVHVFEEGMTFKPISVGPTDADLVAILRSSVEELCRWFSMPPPLVGHLDDAHYNNAQTLYGVVFLRHTIGPTLGRWESVLNLELLTKRDRDRGLYIEFSPNALMWMDAGARAEFYRSGLNSGWLSINDVRVLENRNEVPGGDQHFVPLNMVPLAAAAASTPQDPVRAAIDGHDSVSEQEQRSDPEQRAARSLATRRRLRSSYSRVIEAAAARFLRREIKAVRSAIKAARESDQPVLDFLERIRAEYDRLPDVAQRELAPVILALAEAVVAEVAEERGVDVEVLQLELAAWSAGFARLAAESHVRRSEAQIRKLIEEADDALEAIEQRAGEWESTRAAKIGHHEAVRVAGGAAKLAYAAAGVTLYRWVASGENCPLCARMDGKVVGVEEPFLSEGEELEVEGSNPLKARSNIGHPPLHGGCECDISAG